MFLTSSRSFLLLATLFVTAPLPLPQRPGSSAPPHAPGVRRPLDRLVGALGPDAEDAARAAIVHAFEGTSEFLGLLPLDRLVAARLDGDDLELRFDFDSSSTRTIEIPQRSLVVLEARDASDPLRSGRAVVTKSAARTLIVRSSLRLKLAGDHIAAIRAGDVRVAWGLFEIDLALHTERDPGRIARDEQGRIVLATDEHDVPLRSGGRFVPRSHDLWLVLEARGHRVEIGLGHDGDN